MKSWSGIPVTMLPTRCCRCCGSVSCRCQNNTPQSPGCRWCRELSWSWWQHGKESQELSWLQDAIAKLCKYIAVWKMWDIKGVTTKAAHRFWYRSDNWNHFKSPVHMTAANTQHWPYLTGLQLDWAHFFKMSALPVHLDGWTPFSKSFDQFPFRTPWSSSQLILKKKRKKSQFPKHAGTLPAFQQWQLNSCSSQMFSWLRC